MKNLTLIGLIILTITANLVAQKNSQMPQLSISIFNENFGLNAMPNGNPIHLGGALAIEFTRKKNGVYRATNSLELGYLKHAPIFQAAYLAWKPKYKWQFNNGIQLHTLLGLGYLHALPTQTTYQLEDGLYTAKKNTGKPGGLASIGAGFGYQIINQEGKKLTIFCRQEWMFIAPFNINNSLPFSVNSMISLGVSAQLN